MYSISTQVHTIAGDTVNAIFEDEEEGFITFNSSNLHGQEIRVPVTPEWDESTPHRVACQVGDETLSLQRYEGESEDPDVLEDDGWEEIDVIVGFEQNPDGLPDSPPGGLDI